MQVVGNLACLLSIDFVCIQFEATQSSASSSRLQSSQYRNEIDTQKQSHWKSKFKLDLM